MCTLLIQATANIFTTISNERNNFLYIYIIKGIHNGIKTIWYVIFCYLFWFENFIASDIPAILKYTKNVYFLENGEYVHIVGDKVTVLNENREVVEKEVSEIT